MSGSETLSRGRRSAAPVFAIAAASLSLLAPLAARADVKIVTESTITGLGAPTTIPNTVYYKGDKQRSEGDDGVTIYDCSSDLLYTLNAKDKTYTVAAASQSMQAKASNPMLAMAKIETKEANLTPLSGTKEIAGKTSNGYAYILALHIQPTDPSLSDFIPAFTTTIKGEQWATEAVTGSVPCERMSRLMLSRSLPASVATMGSGVKDILDKVAQIKGLFLSRRVQITMKLDNPKSDAGMPIPKDPIVYTTVVKSLSEAPLEDSLFAVPADYKKIEAPATPAAPGAPPAAAPAQAPAPGTTP